MTRDVWLARHPYLQPVADVQALVEAAAAGLPSPLRRSPTGSEYAADFHAGVPLLRARWLRSTSPRLKRPWTR